MPTQIPLFGFAAPTVGQVRLLMAKAGLPEGEALKFIEYYSSYGWTIKDGNRRRPMTSLPGAVANWANRYRTNNPRNTGCYKGACYSSLSQR